jgi:hypothetical protein
LQHTLIEGLVVGCNHCPARSAFFSTFVPATAPPFGPFKRFFSGGHRHSRESPLRSTFS